MSALQGGPGFPILLPFIYQYIATGVTILRTSPMQMSLTARCSVYWQRCVCYMYIAHGSEMLPMNRPI